VVQTYEVIRNQLKDLAELTVFPITRIAADLTRLKTLLTRLKVMMPFDEGGVDVFYASTFGTIPCTERELMTWMSSKSSVMKDVYHGALLAQTLINDMFELIDCITDIIDQVLTMTGNLQGQQTLGQIQTTIFHAQVRSTAMMGAFNTAMATGELWRLAQQEAERCITQARLQHIPRVNTYGLQLGTGR
jgi:hypothetical protein